MNLNDELAHLVVQASHLGVGDLRLLMYGHIIDYDPNMHLARATLDQFSVIDPNTGQIVDVAQTPWLPLVARNQGDQFAPEIGSQCFVALTDKGTGPGVILAITHPDTMPAVDPTLKPGEGILYNKASKTFLKFFNTGELKISGQHGTLIDIDKDGVITIQGNQNQANSKVTLGADGSISIVTSKDFSWTTDNSQYSIDQLKALFNSHTHPDPQGGNTSPPTQQMS